MSIEVPVSSARPSFMPKASHAFACEPFYNRPHPHAALLVGDAEVSGIVTWIASMSRRPIDPTFFASSFGRMMLSSIARSSRTLLGRFFGTACLSR